MKNIAERLRAKEAEMAAERGPFRLFALFLREGATLGLWDLVASAPWVDPDDRGEALVYIASKVKEALSLEEMMKLSRIELIDTTNPGLEAVHEAVQIEHGLAELRYEEFFGLDIERAYVITSRRAVEQPQALAAAA